MPGQYSNHSISNLRLIVPLRPLPTALEVAPEAQAAVVVAAVADQADHKFYQPEIP